MLPAESGEALYGIYLIIKWIAATGQQGKVRWFWIFEGFSLFLWERKWRGSVKES